MSYHLSRKAISVVKSSLNPKVVNDDTSTGWYPFNKGSPDDTGTRQHGKVLLGLLDTSFLFAMFVMGHVGDRSNIRLFLSGSMIGNGVLSCV